MMTVIIKLTEDRLEEIRHQMRVRDKTAIRIVALTMEFERVRSELYARIEKSQLKEANIVNQFIRAAGHHPDDGTYHLDYETGEISK